MMMKQTFFSAVLLGVIGNSVVAYDDLSTGVLVAGYEVHTPYVAEVFEAAGEIEQVLAKTDTFVTGEAVYRQGSVCSKVTRELVQLANVDVNSYRLPIETPDIKTKITSPVQCPESNKYGLFTRHDGNCYTIGFTLDGFRDVDLNGVVLGLPIFRRFEANVDCGELL